MKEALPVVDDKSPFIDAIVINEEGEILKERQLNKSNAAIVLRVKKGRLSFLAKKTFNVLIYHAQRLQKPGLNVPPGARGGGNLFWVPLNEVAFDASFNSNDTQLLKNTLTELQDIRLIQEDETQWSSDHIINKVVLYKEDGLNTRGGSTVWIGYSFPEDIQEHIFNPGQYTRLSLFYQGQLGSSAALTLYEFCRRYLGNPSRLTAALTWQWAYSFLIGSSLEGRVLVYKYFKRDVLNPAIKEVNTSTDINIELIEIRQGRSVHSIQFRVNQAVQPYLPFDADRPIPDEELINELVNLGMRGPEARSCLQNYGEDRVRNALRYVQQRTAAPGMEKVKSVGAYLRKAIQEGYSITDTQMEVPTKPVRKVRKKNAEEAQEALRNQYRAHQIREALALHKEKSPEERTQELEEFIKSDVFNTLAASTKRTLRSGKPSMLAQTLFGEWLALRYWGEPTINDIMTYAALRLTEQEP